MKGAAPDTRGSPIAIFVACGQSCMASPAPITVACAVAWSKRSRISRWKPLITDSVVIRIITPSAMPTTEASEMKEMKPLRRLARR